MTNLQANPAKQMEIAYLRAFVAALPADSYLATILGNIEGGIVTAIKNDFGFIDWHEMTAQQITTRKEIEAAKAERDNLRAERDAMSREITRLGDALVALKRQAKAIWEAK